MASPERARAGTRYRAQVRTVHPVTSRPVKGVSVEAKFEFDSDDNLPDMKVTGVTDENGYAALDFDLPLKIEGDSDLDLEVVARRGGFTQEADDEIEIDRLAQMYITTDKPIYQPGQVLHARALVFDSQKRALADTDAKLEIVDPEDQTVFSADLKTSRFGIASADWAIPDQIRLGDYSITIDIDGDDDGARGYARVKVSRYDLPNFTVNVKPDLPYYLPGQDASVEVRADYLFGKPVKRGHVRLVREEERRWNYPEQKWEMEEGEEFEGEADESGKFVARIGLAKEHEELQKEDYSRYQDLSYAAYFTDPTTNRTEQRRFNLRLTKSAIHVYLIEDESRQAKDFPLHFYLSTYYADGAPAECEVAISESVTSKTADGSGLNSYEQPLRTVRTNRYGVAEVSDLGLTKAAGDDTEATLTFLAHDARGSSGRQTNSFWYSDNSIIRLETNKMFYRAGEPIRTLITGSEPEMKVVFDVWQGAAVLRSQVVQLHEGRASITVPYNKAFKDGVSLRAFSYSDLDSQSRYNIPRASRRVLYPRQRDLQLDVRLDQSTYKPGEEAHASFTVRGPDGRPLESALGVVVLDRAVEERARTDEEFGPAYGFYNAYRSLSGYEGEMSGLTVEDFFKLDMAKPVPEGMELVAKILLREDGYTPNVFGGRTYSLDQREVFSNLIARQVKPMEEALATRYSMKMEYPGDEAGLRRLLAEAGLDFGQQRDPWGTPFRAAFSIERQSDELKVTSAGADKRFDTDDDFTATRLQWPYFRPTGETLDRAVAGYHKRTGNHVRDAATTESELRAQGLDFTALRDRWGKPYRLEFETSGTNFTVAVKSGGPNGKFETADEDSSDDFVIWTAFSDYFAEKRAEVSSALADHLRLTGLFPQNEEELRAPLERAQVNLEAERDPWGRGYYTTFTNDPRYAAGFSVRTYSTYGDATKQAREASPSTQPINLIRLRSLGADGQQATADDFDVAALSRKEIELISKGQQQPSHASVVVIRTGESGAIIGTVTDPNGSAIPNAMVTATHVSSFATYTATTDDEGRFRLGNLPAGFYSVRFVAPGFMDYVVSQVPVRSSNVTRLDGSLNVGNVTETVEVTSAGGATLNTTNASVAKVINSFQLDGVERNGRAQISTPRLREYFPETLVWQPSLETDAGGRARLDFKLADSITTWKMAVIGSTADGEVGVVEKEILAFQPFFVEHDPPRVLTEGDEIELPVVLRNYLDKPQAVEVEIKPESWFALSGPARKRAEVPSGESSRETFNFRAISAVRDGKQRITATATDASDAIEKPVLVHPDGEERAVTASQILGDSTALDLSIPEDLIKDSLRADLKIYPNLLSHVAESVGGILERPHGCGEQTISSTYPNLMILRFDKAVGKDSAVTAKAREYLREGYKRLLNYRAESGGFSYWGGADEANFALTAYALRFLSDAREFVEVDESVLTGARDFLVKQQRPDGSWSSFYHGTNEITPREDALLTSYIARIIASLEARGGGKGGASTTQGTEKSPASLALKRALDYLTLHLNEAGDAYTLASYTLAALDAGETAGAGRALTKLRALAHAGEAGTVSWESELGTPFHGWGMTGSIETTALAVQALARGSEAGLSSADDGAMLNRALLYLLRQKDRYGVWYSTQATINVLNALIVVFSRQGGSGVWGTVGADTQAEVIINGRPALNVTLPGGRLNNPVTVDISRFVSTGNNRIIIRRGSIPLLASAQVVSTFYVPWSVAQTAHGAEPQRNLLRLAVGFSKKEAAINEEITCRVEVGGRNYGGMLLGEIGLPPGADVDRASLESAIKNSEWSLSRYDVLPDRVVVYLWPRPSGTKFEFKFRPRFGLAAQSAPSLLYDYYNPEARAILAPTKFTVR
ncbi:MAG TPA: MG2 domain-containing protein [Pyrinomonadaceae bacterium]|nr:MG2 domain-containing protein [Pyrinomonadaceae bacterium]